jgi:PIN domain nuclease of toxin-antitoxin system
LAGILLDTHALFWLVSGHEQLSDDALIAIAESQEAGALYVSPITAWELAIAAQKPRHRDRPNLRDASPAQWFRDALEETTAKLIPINEQIAVEAAEVVIATGHKDPGDCYLIATARVAQMPLVTRDIVMQKLALSSYLQVILC